MDWKDVGQKILSYAPEAAELAASFIPGGPLLGVGVKALCGVLGVRSGDPQPAEVMQALDDPKASDTVRLAMIQFNAEKMRLEYLEKDKKRDDEIEELKTSLADVQNARTREIEQTKATGKRDANLYVLAWVMVGGFLALITFLLFVPVPTDQSGVIFMLFGALSSGFGSVIAYFFGSSAGSKEKDSLLLNSVPTGKIQKTP